MSDIPDDIRATAKAFVDDYLASDSDLEGFIAEALMAERERGRHLPGSPAYWEFVEVQMVKCKCGAGGHLEAAWLDSLKADKAE